MKVILRHSALDLYFQDLDRWTNDRLQAVDFGEVEDAIEMAQSLGCADCEVVFLSVLFPCEIRVPLKLHLMGFSLLR